MNPFAPLDAELFRRAADEGWKLSLEWDGSPARFFYTGGDAPYECFQVSIEPPSAGQVRIFALSVDTNDDQEFEESWRGAVADFPELLEAALCQIEIWKRRNR